MNVKIPDKFLMESVYYGINKDFASKELKDRGYRDIMVSGSLPGWMDSFGTLYQENGELWFCEGPVPFTMEAMLNVLEAEERTPQRMYVRAYPETIDLLKDLCKDCAHGLKGKTEAKILDEALKAYLEKK